VAGSAEASSLRPTCDAFRSGLFGPANVWSHPPFPQSIQSELFYTDAAKRAALDYIKEAVMGPQIDRSSVQPFAAAVSGRCQVCGRGIRRRKREFACDRPLRRPAWRAAD
jgi:hypothetical protein